MIINQDIKPEKQAYYLGAQIISALKDEESTAVELLNVFETLNEKERVSYHAFSMAMNWLYLIGVINLKGKEIIKCF